MQYAHKSHGDRHQGMHQRVAGQTALFNYGYSLNGGSPWTNAGSTVTILATDTTSSPRFEFRTITVPPSWR